MQLQAEPKGVLSALYRRLVFALSLISLALVAGSVGFWAIWRHGDAKAEAFAGLLQFFATIISSCVTIVYVYLTHASLRKAQQAIELQAEQLQHMKASLSLQRQEWEQKVQVVPQFWLETFGEATWHIPDPSNPGSNRLQPLRFGKRFRVKVWNYSEQSFLIDMVALQRVDCVMMMPDYCVVEANIVVRPHSIETVEVSQDLMILLTRSTSGNPTAGVMVNDLDPLARIVARITFTDWSRKQARSDLRDFELRYRPGDLSITIVTPQQSTSMRAVI